MCVCVGIIAHKLVLLKCTPYISYYPRVTMSICSEWPGYLPDDANEAGLSYCDALPYIAPIPNRSYVPIVKPNQCGVKQH